MISLAFFKHYSQKPRIILRLSLTTPNNYQLFAGRPYWYASSSHSIPAHIPRPSLLKLALLYGRFLVLGTKLRHKLEISGDLPLSHTMENRISTPHGFSQAPSKGQPKALHIGAIVEARVLNQSGQSLNLQIGQKIVTAKLAGSHGILPKTGRFEVVSTEPTPVLKLQKPAALSTNTGAHKLARHALPLQRPLKHMLSQMNAFINASQGTKTSAMGKQQPGLNLLSVVGEVVKNIETKLPSLGVLTTAAGLRRAIHDSGGFLENRLTELGPNEISKDFKSSLLQARDSLHAALRSRAIAQSSTAASSADLRGQMPTPTESLINKSVSVDSLLKALEAGISRIETLQLANQVLATNGQNLVYLEMPLKFGNQMDSIQLVIEQEEQADNPSTEVAESSTIYLALSIEKDQDLRAKVSFRAGDISVTLWSDNEALQDQLHRRVHQLSNTLSSNLGRETNIAVRAFADKFPEPSKIFSGLISESA